MNLDKFKVHGPIIVFFIYLSNYANVWELICKVLARKTHHLPKALVLVVEVLFNCIESGWTLFIILYNKYVSDF